MVRFKNTMRIAGGDKQVQRLVGGRSLFSGTHCGGHDCTGCADASFYNRRLCKVLFSSAFVLIIAATLLFYGQQPASGMHTGAADHDDEDCFGMSNHAECECPDWASEERFAAMDHSRPRNAGGTPFETYRDREDTDGQEDVPDPAPA